MVLTAEPRADSSADADVEMLRSLLELHDDGMKVNWPKGFDAISARHLTDQRSKAEHVHGRGVATGRVHLPG